MVTHTTVAGLFRPSDRVYAAVYDLILVVCGSVLIAVCAHVKFLLPISVVPVTGQTFAVLMLGALLGSRRAVLCVLAYLAEGAAGLPVFAAAAGPAALFGPTGGYLAGFIPAAYITGRLAEAGWDRRPAQTVLAMTLGNLAIYACGVGWLSILVGVKSAVLTGVIPFIPGDTLKILLAAAILPTGWKLIGRVGPTLKEDGPS